MTCRTAAVWVGAGLVNQSEAATDVRLNGRRVIDDLDLAGQVGRYRVVRRQFAVRVGAGEALTLSLEAEDGSPLLNAIQLTRRP